SAIIAFAGGLMAPRFRIIDPDSYGILASIFALAYPIVGGMGSIWGGLLGGGVLRTVPEVLRPLADYIELIFCILVVATISLCPDGFASLVSRWFARRRQAVKSAAVRQDAQKSRVTHDLSVIHADVPDVQRASDAARQSALRIDRLTKSFGALRA